MENLFCCKSMEENALLQKPNDDCDFVNSDKLIYYNEIFDEYGLIVHNGGQSYIMINFCPWCGKKLPQSVRDKYFLELEKLEDYSPFEDELPDKFKTDAWREK